MNEIHYVYILSILSSGKIFYVGKGQGSRHLMHQRLARLNASGERYRYIRSLISAGDGVLSTILAEYENPRHAYDHERKLIIKFNPLALVNSSRWRGPFGRPVRCVDTANPNEGPRSDLLDRPCAPSR